MNNAMITGADVINGKKLVKNYLPGNQRTCNLVTACNGLIWTFMDEMGNRWKSDHGFTTMTITTGILISKKLVEKWGGWIYRATLTEDMELERDCALQGYKTFYYSYAKIYMEEAPSLEMTNKRHTRWMTGVTHSDLLYGPKLLKKEKTFYNLVNNYYVFYAFIFCRVSRRLLHHEKIRRLQKNIHYVKKNLKKHRTRYYHFRCF